MFLVCLLAFVLALAAFVVGLLEGASDIRYTVISFIYLSLLILLLLFIAKLFHAAKRC